ncbi:MAG: class I SAM-dependent rRNA methyltransferase [Bacteroidia bacterium]|nr:class I SAM-dependent rRNA methyltransferase [Bacteroidia bacterium]
MYSKIFLKYGKEKSLLRYHLWVFSGAIEKTEGNPENGDIVEIFSSKNEFLALGHYQNGSIMVRILSFEKEVINVEFWLKKINNAWDVRKKSNLPEYGFTNVFRLIHGEGDNCPGLVIDVYYDSVVVQAHSIGMSNSANDILSALNLFDKLTFKNIILKDEVKNFVKPFFGNESKTEVIENGNKFYIDLISGQKTGFFIDQRENRKLLGSFCKDKKVLNMFGYTGGFSVYAAHGGALLVHTVDSSESAIQTANNNMKLNNYSNIHTGFVDDAFEFLKNMNEEYDIVILDPPAFAKHLKSLSNAREAYIRLNKEAFKKIKKGGIIFTFSCSQVVSKEIFRSAVFTAAIQAKRNLRILSQLTQPSCHPINLFHPESEYLKGLVLYVD